MDGMEYPVFRQTHTGFTEMYKDLYANIWGILMGSMLPCIAAPWILWVYENRPTAASS